MRTSKVPPLLTTLDCEDKMVDATSTAGMLLTRKTSGIDSPLLAPSPVEEEEEDDDDEEDLILQRDTRMIQPANGTARTISWEEDTEACESGSARRRLKHSPGLRGHPPPMLTGGSGSGKIHVGPPANVSSGHTKTPSLQRIQLQSINLKQLEQHGVVSPGIESHSSTRTPQSLREGGSDTTHSITSPHTPTIQQRNRRSSMGLSTSLSMKCGDSALGSGNNSPGTPLVSWDEIEPISTPLSGSFWFDVLNQLSATTDWQTQCSALTSIRKVALYCSSCLSEPLPPSARRSAIGGGAIRPGTSISNALLQRLLPLTESLRSLVVRSVLVTLHDLFLFAAEHLDSQTSGEALMVCLRRAAAGGFIGEEAFKCWRQIVLMVEPERVLRTLEGALAKQARNNSGLRSQCILAACFFSLRLNQFELRTVCGARTFPTKFLRPIVRAAWDANAECRAAATQCLSVLINLVPDMWVKHRQSLIDVDESAVLTKLAKAPPANIKAVFGLTGMLQLYRAIPESAPVDSSLERLQTVLSNIEEICDHPLLRAKESGTKTVARSSTTTRTRTPITYNSAPRMKPHYETLDAVTSIRCKRPEHDVSRLTVRENRGEEFSPWLSRPASAIPRREHPPFTAGVAVNRTPTLKTKVSGPSPSTATFAGTTLPRVPNVSTVGHVTQTSYGSLRTRW